MSSKLLVKTKKRKFNQEGQTLVEVLVALAVAVTVVVALVTAVVASMRNAQYSKLQLQATKFSQEALEKARAERDKNGWTSFNTTYTGVKCLKADGSWVAGNCGAGDRIDGIFSREVNFVDNGDTKNITATTSWTDSSSAPHKSELRTYLTKWRE